MAKISLRMFVLGIVFSLALWVIVAHLLAMPVIPPPEQVLLRLAQKFTDVIAVHAGYSLMRIVLGLAAAVAVGYPVGVLMGYFPRVNRLLAPLLYLTYPVPKIALLPVVMLLFGVGETSKLLLVFLIIVFQVVVAVRDAVVVIPAETYAPLRVLGASFAQIVRHLTAEVHHGCARGDGNGDLCAVLHGDVRHAVRHRLLYYGRVAARELPRYVCGHRCSQYDGAAALCPARLGGAAPVCMESIVNEKSG